MEGWLVKKKKNIEGLGNKEFETESFILISDKEDAFISMLKNSISVDVDDKTGLIIVSSTTPDPYVSAILTDTVGKRLQSYITRYRTTKAKLDYDYFDKMSDEAETKYKNSLNAYADNVDSNMLAVLQRVKGKQEKLESDVALAAQVYTQLKQKKELAKAKIQEVKPAFVVIDPVSVPLKTTGIGRLLTILLSFIMGGVLASMWILVGREIWGRLKRGNG
ncbi:GNVR domain-containing protein [Paraprevotella clara]|uniref:GNVR domain-containing protein n=1 Tax=Paraprevotella clara TaxID=454154 RepID=UPI00300F58EF